MPWIGDHELNDSDYEELVLWIKANSRLQILDRQSYLDEVAAMVKTMKDRQKIV